MKEARFVAQAQHLDEPRVHKRFWAAVRRARYSAKALLSNTPEVPADPFVLYVAPGLGFNVTSSGIFIVGHMARAVTSLVQCTQSR